jgi:hypothetical protein
MDPTNSEEREGEDRRERAGRLTNVFESTDRNSRDVNGRHCRGRGRGSRNSSRGRRRKGGRKEILSQALE